MNKLFSKLNIILLVSFLVILDQVSKIVVKLNMKIGDSIDVFNFFKIYFIENNGMAFGLELGGSIGKLVLSLFRIILVIFIAIWVKKMISNKEPKLLIFSLLLILSGAIGNIIDSLAYGVLFGESTFSNIASFLPEGGGYAPIFFGKVVDMIYIPLWEGFLPEWLPIWGGNHFIFFEPIFNIADSYVTIGIFIMIYQQLIYKPKQ